MNHLLTATIFVLGAVLGGQLNRGIYRLAWYRRAIGPWSAAASEAPPRRWTDYLPILGWFGLRRESALHGTGYWIRPLLLELAVGLGFAALYVWEVECHALLPRAARPPFDPGLLWAQYLGHVLLISLMLVATFIDFDEQTIPDAITVPGTVVGLILMGTWPAVCPVTVDTLRRQLIPQLLSSPQKWAPELDGRQGLYLGLACFCAWVLAVWPRTVTMRRGVRKAVQYLVVSMFRYSGWWIYIGLLGLGSAGIVAVWLRAGPYWPSLLSALVGMAFGGGLIWAVRIVGGGALGKEAMGFGDVTLMAMIGTFLGWQAALVIFFLAPFNAVLICLVQWLLTRRRAIAFGPYLCAAALMLILGWEPLWEARARGIFTLGWLIPQLVACCLVLLGGMLMLWRLIEQALFGRTR